MAAQHSLVACASRVHTIQAEPHASDLASDETSDEDLSLSLVTPLGFWISRKRRSSP